MYLHLMTFTPINKADQSIQTYDKQNGLSSIGIRFIGWNEIAKRLVIVYEDGNIDLLDAKGNVTNVPDYYLKALTADKRSIILI